MLIGAAEDFVKQPDPVLAKENMDLAALAGFDSVRVTAVWSGESEPSATELGLLQNASLAAQLTGIQLFVAVYPRGSRWTPLTEPARAQFAGFAAALARALPLVTNFIVGNEPNLNRFWMPQFNLDGSDAAAPAYAALLARTYDALKAVSPRINVIGGALAPRGEDRQSSARHTQSPPRFISDLGIAYRASRRTAPLMDMFAFHPYQGGSPTVPRPNSKAVGISDYGRLVALLGRAFDGTRQLGSRLPILYAEYGVESQIPPHLAILYTGREPTTTRPVDEATQAAYYRQAIELAHCQPTVRGIILFHVADEQPLEGWQSGVFYADRGPKTNLATVRNVLAESRRGALVRCTGVVHVPLKARLVFPSSASVAARRLGVTVQCDINCAYRARLERLPRSSPTLTVRGRATANVARRTSLARKRLAPGLYRFRVSVAATIPRSKPIVRVSRPFRVGAATRRAASRRARVTERRPKRGRQTP